MKYTAPPASLFIKNRKKFAARMAPGHIGIFFSNELLVDNADSHYPFKQDSSMYYLSGIDQEECMLVIFPDAPRNEWKEILFIRKTSPTIQIWEGWKYSPEEATAASGISSIKYFEEFRSTLKWMVSQADGIYLDLNEHERNGLRAHTAAHQFAEDFRKEFPAHSIKRAAPILEDLRSVKEPEEIVQMREAIAITEKAFRRVMKFIKPGVWEHEIEAEIQHEFLRNRATGPAYGSIIASGRNACVLHYVQNNMQCADGDVILMDFGSEYGNYSSDLTRCLPVNGKFTPRQKDVYNAVLRVMKAATEMLKPGTIIEEYHKEVGKIMEAELLGLKLITKEDIAAQDPAWPAYKKYFMHGTSHYLGLDTHDVGSRYKPMKPGMVFTVEPGIYILEEKLGIRIENNILITENGNEDLMRTIPREVEEIEALMKG